MNIEKTVSWDGKNLEFIDQRKLPLVEERVTISRIDEVTFAIEEMQIRGAPLIGIKGCAIVSHGKSDSKAIENAIYQAITYVDTGVNKHIVSRLEALQ